MRSSGAKLSMPGNGTLPFGPKIVVSSSVTSFGGAVCSRHDAEGHAGDPIDIEGFHHVGDGREIDARAGEDDDVARRIDLQRRIFRHKRLQRALQIRSRNVAQRQDLHVVGRARHAPTADRDRRRAEMRRLLVDAVTR